MQQPKILSLFLFSYAALAGCSAVPDLPPGAKPHASFLLTFDS